MLAAMKFWDSSLDSPRVITYISARKDIKYKIKLINKSSQSLYTVSQCKLHHMQQPWEYWQKTLVGCSPICCLPSLSTMQACLWDVAKRFEMRNSRYNQIQMTPIAPFHEIFLLKFRTSEKSSLSIKFKLQKNPYIQVWKRCKVCKYSPMCIY